MNSQEERIILKEKLHWGMVIPALLSAIVVLLGMVPVLFVMRGLTRTFQQFSPQAQTPLFALWWFAIPELVILVPVIIGTTVSYFTSEIALTNKRLKFKTGLLSRSTGELPLQNVEGIFLIEPFFGRIFGYGTVSVTSVGGTAFPFRYIRAPQLFHANLQKTVNESKHPLRKGPDRQPPPNDDSRYMPKG